MNFSYLPTHSLNMIFGLVSSSSYFCSERTKRILCPHNKRLREDVIVVLKRCVCYPLTMSVYINRLVLVIVISLRMRPKAMSGIM